MKFSVVMASFLGPYANAAHNREEKILRAVNSVLTQSYQDLELIVVGDGCADIDIILQPAVHLQVEGGVYHHILIVTKGDAACDTPAFVQTL